MKIFRVVIFLVISLSAWVPFRGTRATSTLWHPISDGIEYREFFLSHPNHLYVARMERNNPNVALESSIAQGRLSGGLETVRNMADRYDQAINYWGEDWGSRNQVIVAINGYFYDTETGVPWSGQFHSGWYAKRFDDHQSGSGFAWTLNRDALIGGCIVHRPAKQFITHIPSGSKFLFDDINIPRDQNSLIIYTPQYDSSTLTDDDGIEILVELEKPLIISPSPAMVTGWVRQININQGSTPIPFDNIVISASGNSAENLSQVLHVGDEVGISQEIHHFSPDCATPNPQSWSQVYAGIGNSYVFLKDGAVQKLGDLGEILRNPRTAIAYNDRYIFFLVVDGRQQLESLGMSMVELAVFTKMYLGASWGVALDGGGSSTMIVNGELKNRPGEKLGSSGIPSVASIRNIRKIKMDTIIAPIQAQSNFNTPEERAVANGMMMVVVEPMDQSQLFQPGDQIFISKVGNADVHLGPGTNFAIIGFVQSNQTGTIQTHSMNGVYAKNSYWWKITFDDVTGWVSEDAITK